MKQKQINLANHLLSILMLATMMMLGFVSGLKIFASIVFKPVSFNEISALVLILILSGSMLCGMIGMFLSVPVWMLLMKLIIDKEEMSILLGLHLKESRMLRPLRKLYDLFY